MSSLKSVKLEDKRVWVSFRRRAEDKGFLVSDVFSQLITRYGNGEIDVDVKKAERNYPASVHGLEDDAWNKFKARCVIDANEIGSVVNALVIAWTEGKFDEKSL